MAMKILSRERRGTETRFKVTSESDARKHYVVLRVSERKWKCACKSWIIPKKLVIGRRVIRRRVNCKHIRFVAGRAA
jgi:hypothetical protein